MAIKSGFFNSVDGDRTYNANDFSTIYEGLLKSGVVRGVGGELYVESIYDYKIFVKTGKCIVGDKWLKNTGNDCILSVEPAHENLDRVDMVIAGLFESERKVDIKIIKGVPSANPKEPEVDFPHIKLAKIKLERGGTGITNEMIEDMREYAEICTENEAVKWESEKVYYTGNYNSPQGIQLLPKEKGSIVINDCNTNGKHDLKIRIWADLKMSDGTFNARSAIYAKILEQLQHLEFSSMIYSGYITDTTGILHSMQGDKNIPERVTFVKKNGEKMIGVNPTLDTVSQFPNATAHQVVVNIAVSATEQWIERKY